MKIKQLMQEVNLKDLNTPHFESRTKARWHVELEVVSRKPWWVPVLSRDVDREVDGTHLNSLCTYSSAKN